MSEERRESMSKSSLGSKGSSTPTQDHTDAAQRDLEANKPVVPQESKENEKPKDPNLVTWDGPQDEENPKNWPSGTVPCDTYVMLVHSTDKSCTSS